MRPLMRKFLEVDARLKSEPSSESLHSAPSISSTASVPSDTNVVESKVEEVKDSSNLDTLEIEVPAGVREGQCIQVVVPDGREALVTVPRATAVECLCSSNSILKMARSLCCLDL